MWKWYFSKDPSFLHQRHLQKEPSSWWLCKRVSNKVKPPQINNNSYKLSKRAYQNRLHKDEFRTAVHQEGSLFLQRIFLILNILLWVRFCFNEWVDPLKLTVVVAPLSQALIISEPLFSNWYANPQEIYQDSLKTLFRKMKDSLGNVLKRAFL